MKQSFKILAVIFSVALNITFLAAYGVRKISDRPRYAYEELDLSGDQRKHLENARDRFLRAVNEIGNEIIGRHIELIDLVASERPDSQAIEIKFQEIHTLQRSMQRRVVEHLLEDKNVLAPEQRARFFAVLKSRIREQGAPGPPWLPAGARQRK
jgi:Spy/CpxP family protein refolding chaperone